MKHHSLPRWTSWLVLAVFSAAPLTLARDVLAETPTDVKAASLAEAARRAQAAYDVQDFPVAIKEYRAVYQVEQRPEFLWGLAQSLRMSGDFKSAVLSYKAYRRGEVTTNQATAAELMIARCEAEIAKREAEAAKAQSAAEPPHAAAVEPAPREPRAAPEPHEAAPPPPSAPKGPKRFYEDALGDVLFVAGVAAAGTGGYFLLKGNAEVRSGNDAGTYGSHTDSIDRGESKQTIGALTLGAGGALLLGATWRFLSFDPGPTEQVSVGLGTIDFRTQF